MRNIRLFRGSFGPLLSMCLVTLSMCSVAWALIRCDEDLGGGVCPNHSTCCPTGTAGQSTCITGRKLNNTFVGAVCCYDGKQVPISGCAFGFACVQSNKTDRPYCSRQDGVADPNLPKALPRYRLYAVDRVQSMLGDLHAFPIDAPVNNHSLAYFSSMGSLHANAPDDLARQANVSSVFIMIHGSGRDAADYLYGAVSSLLDHQVRDAPDDFDMSSVLVIAPYFKTPDDEPKASESYLTWNDKGPINHTWRYGAEAVEYNVSSYATVDYITEYLQESRVRFPKLRRILVTGHSAGGQFVQRWALLSPSPVWNSSAIHTRVVVANPRSFCYLDAERIINETLRLPDQKSLEACPSYNQWEWGLSPGGKLTVPFKDNAISQAGGTLALTRRYALQRDVIYLAGEHDTLLQNDSCVTFDFQGPNRRERSARFFRALQERFSNSSRHKRFLAAGSPHDHVLMYQSDGGREALYQGYQKKERPDA